MKRSYEHNMDKIGNHLLDALRGEQNNRQHSVILMLAGKEGIKTEDLGFRQSKSLRVTQSKEIVAKTLPLIDKVLENLGGRRLRNDISAMRSVVVEGPAQTILALAELDEVEAVIENQPIFPIREVEHKR